MGMEESSLALKGGNRESRMVDFKGTDLGWVPFIPGIHWLDFIPSKTKMEDLILFLMPASSFPSPSE